MTIKKISKHVCFNNYLNMFSIVTPLLEHQNKCVSLPFCVDDLENLLKYPNYNGLVLFLEEYEIGYVTTYDNTIRFYKNDFLKAKKYYLDLYNKLKEIVKLKLKANINISIPKIYYKKVYVSHKEWYYEYDYHSFMAMYCRDIFANNLPLKEVNKYLKQRNEKYPYQIFTNEQDARNCVKEYAINHNLESYKY